MGSETGIAWTDHTFNPWWGCVRVSPGCEHCYAETWDTRWRGGHWGPGTERRFFDAKHWNEPVRWDRLAEHNGRRDRVFCASMADVFEDRRDLDDQRQRLWHLILDTPNLDWQLLTKRPQNLRKFLPPDWLDQPLPNVWLGTTVEDQQRADERIPHLIAAPARVHFLSVEPLIGPVSLRWLPAFPENAPHIAQKPGPSTDHLDGLRRIGWVIVGGESGAGARPMDLAWSRTIVEQCKDAGVPCFVKQLGGAHDKQDDPRAWPDDLRIREFPETTA